MIWEETYGSGPQSRVAVRAILALFAEAITTLVLRVIQQAAETTTFQTLMPTQASVSLYTCNAES
jgi:hypothetical protein